MEAMALCGIAFGLFIARLAKEPPKESQGKPYLKYMETYYHQK